MLSLKKVWKPIEGEELEQAQKLADESRPLRYAPIEDVLPVLRKCRCKLSCFFSNSPEVDESAEETTNEATSSLNSEAS